MKYSKKQLREGLFFIRIEGGETLEKIRKIYKLDCIPDFGKKRYDEIGSINFDTGGWCKKEGEANWYLNNNYKEVFLHELKIDEYYEIY